MTSQGPYTAAHFHPQGPGDARPTALDIIHDQNLTNTLQGKTIVITGATSGIGLETARAISESGATLLLTARDIPRAQSALSDILAKGCVRLVEMDNSRLESIRKAAGDILALGKGKVNVLICNAGVMGVQELALTEDGFEMHFGTNYLGHFLLFQLLKNALLAGSTESFNSRVVVVASSAQRAGHVLPGWDWNFTSPESRYDWNVAYANSKLASVYMANEIERRYGSQGLHALSLHPGAINSGIARHIGQGFVDMLLSDENVVRVLKSPEQGAATTVVAAVGREWEGRGGKYLEDCEEAETGIDDENVFGRGFVDRTYNEVVEGWLWGASMGLVGLEGRVNCT
ncbi:hypothetical protein BDV12DRAFT_210736 [Aspergillus spectabilis]